MRRVRALLVAASALFATPAIAGPPYDTDDPVPTERGHWEVYAFSAGEGLGRAFDGAIGVDVNYGPVEDVQLTATLPLTLSRDTRTTLRGGDVELGVKYRFVHREKQGVSAAIFPRAILPTGGGRGVGVLLPVWAQQDFGRWSMFGGGGYAINPGTGNSDHGFAALAVTRAIGERMSLGIEATRSGPDTIDARAVSTLGIGGIRKVGGPFSILASVGPTREDGTPTLRYHGYLALGVAF